MQVNPIAVEAAFTTPSQPKTYRVKAVADQLDVHVSTVYRLIGSGALKALRIAGSIRIPAESLAAYLASAEQAAVTAEQSEVTK